MARADIVNVYFSLQKQCFLDPRQTAGLSIRAPVWVCTEESQECLRGSTTISLTVQSKYSNSPETHPHVRAKQVSKMQGCSGYNLCRGNLPTLLLKSWRELRSRPFILEGKVSGVPLGQNVAGRDLWLGKETLFPKEIYSVGFEAVMWFLPLPPPIPPPQMPL